MSLSSIINSAFPRSESLQRIPPNHRQRPITPIRSAPPLMKPKKHHLPLQLQHLHHYLAFTPLTHKPRSRFPNPKPQPPSSPEAHNTPTSHLQKAPSNSALIAEARSLPKAQCSTAGQPPPPRDENAGGLQRGARGLR